MSRPILIIDDSENTLIRIKEFLEKLGQKDIYTEKQADSGLKKFQELGKSGIHPVVFLDYDFHDGSGMSLLSKLLADDVDGEIVILTSLDKNSPIISKLIDEGAYEIIQKPIRFEMIKNVLSVIQLENNDDLKFDIESLLKTTNRLSEIWLKENSQLSDEDLQNKIKQWIEDKKIIQIDDIKEICCPLCNSVKTGHLFHCPQCKKSDFGQSDLIEHYDCGYVDLEKNFQNDTCPSCKKPLKALGVDFRKMKDYFFCNICDNKFTEVGCDFICLKCNERFSEDNGSWKSSRGFKVINST